MERELNKLFNDTNYDKENMIIREIWSIKLEFPNFFEEFRCVLSYPPSSFLLYSLFLSPILSLLKSVYKAL